MKIVLKIGGSIIVPDRFDTGFLKEFSKKVVEWEEKNELAIVAGGGKLSRDYDVIGRKLKKGEEELDKLGIFATRVNAAVLIAALGGNAHNAIPRDEAEFAELAKKSPKKIVVCGGFKPGQRTDAVAVQIAKMWNADLIIKGTNVDYAYDSDPNKNKRAKPIERMSFEQLKELADKTHRANQPTIMDKVAAELLCEYRIKTAVLNGRNLENIEKAIKGENFIGTKIGFRDGNLS